MILNVIKYKYHIFSAILFIITPLFYYEIFKNYNGGIFCNDAKPENFREYVFNKEIVCINYGSNSESRSKHMGNEYMMMLKGQANFSAQCVWFNDQHFKAHFVKSGEEVDPTFPCDTYDQVYLSEAP